MTHHGDTSSSPKRRSFRVSPSLADRLAKLQAAGGRNWKRSVLTWILIIAIIILP
jgi:hypothetical protein